MKKNKKVIYWTAAVILLLLIGILLVKSAINKEAELPSAKQYAVVVSTIKPQMNEVSLTLP